MFIALKSGALVLNNVEFMIWYKKESRKGKWVSQRERKHGRVGRSSKRTAALRHKILAIVNSGAWNGKGKVSDLHRILVADGVQDIVSHDTLGRLVDTLFQETGDAQLRRRSRRRRRPE